MKLPIGKMTSGGKPSVDVGVLQELENKAPLVADVLEMRKLEKIAGTYLTGWEREIGSDGIMRPFYHLATARTFRSSSSSPNLQNVPIRDKIAQRACRRAVYPRAGHRLVEVDYSGIEVRVSACVHKDPQMIKYITDKTTDMHRDMAMECYKLELDEVSKAARQGAKNQFVFPEFYGSYWKNTGPGLWKWAQDCETAQGVSLIKHLKKHGLGTELRFMKHIRKVEDRFWNERFRVYNQWKEKFWKQYLRNGYFETLTGFRCQGPMRKNEVVNYPIQGCLQKGSRVWTSCGLIPIEKLVGISTNVWTGFNWANAVGVDMGSSQLAEIELSSGIIIHCDVRHKIKNENNKWVDFDDIQIGTKVALPKQPDVILPSDHITENFIYGFIIGDGCISNATRKSVEISVGQAKENDLIEIYKYMLQHMKLTRKYGGAHLYPKNQKGKIRLSVQNMEFAEKLEKLGFIFGSTAHTKSVPEYVWTAPIQHMRNFLEGLWCSDGAKLPWQQGNLHMCNLKLLREIQILSGILGYDSYISKTKTGFLLRFSARGFNKKAYRRYPMKHIHLCVSNISPDNYENKNQYVTDLRAFRKIKDPTQYIGERIIEKNARNAEVYRFDTVVNIRKLPVVENTYTMSVDDSLHQFVADGVITKNSAFHCLLKAKALTKQWIAEQRLEQDVLPCGQVHDSGMFSTAPDVFEHFAVNVHRIWCEELRKAWDWIIVPLEIEIDVTPVDGNWFQKEEYKIEVH